MKYSKDCHVEERLAMFHIVLKGVQGVNFIVYELYL